MKYRQLLLGAVLLSAGLSVGIVAGIWWQIRHPAAAAAVHTPRTQQNRHVLYWANPMNPAIHAHHPKKDNMGMKYIPVYSAPLSSGHSAQPGLSVSSRMVQALGVRLAAVSERQMGHSIETVGTVTADSNRFYTINPHFSGWVKHLSIRAVGDPIQRGQIVAQIYSPELYNAEQNYLVALTTRNTHLGNGLLQAAVKRLQLLGLSSTEIQQLKRRGVVPQVTPVYAPISGVVENLQVHQGGYISPQKDLMQLANLNRVWVKVALYDHQLPWVHPGDLVTLRLPAYPGKTWKGRVNFIYPTLNAQNRTVTARLSFENPGGILRPGMYAVATVLTQAKRALAIPSSAILRTQEGNFVMVAEPGSHFLPVQIKVGPEVGGWTAVPKGLRAGERVVENSQFLLYSESQFQSVKARMLRSNAAPTESTRSTFHNQTATQAPDQAAPRMKGMAMGSSHT